MPGEGRDGVVSIRSHSMQSLQRMIVDNSIEKKVMSTSLLSSTVVKVSLASC